VSNFLTNINGWQIPVLSAVNQLVETTPPALLCPARENIYRALTYFPPAETRVVILGQDPYNSVDAAGNKKAWGLSFGYSPSYTGETNSSLLNISREVERAGRPLADRSLDHWARQGVLLLNTQLTTELGHPLVHRGMWNTTVAAILGQVTRAEVVWIAWGAPARKLALRYAQCDEEVPTVIYTSHPCKYSATRGSVPFVGSDPFNRANRILQFYGRRPIQWGGGCNAG